MRVLKVVAEGQVTSFRYPHFLMGTQPTFEMPPPATIYGHIASALGEWFDPTGVQFGMHFTYTRKFVDVESTILLTPSTGRLKGTRLPKVLEGASGPLNRELLFQPRLTLYLNRPEWAPAFRSPRYVVSMGRSQDLFSYTDVREVELQESTSAYLEHTLAPFEMSRRTGRGIAVLMPLYLDWSRNRYPTFQRYVVIHGRVHSRDLLLLQDEPLCFWVDPTSREIGGDQMAIPMLAWKNEDGDGEQPIPG